MSDTSLTILILAIAAAIAALVWYRLKARKNSRNDRAIADLPIELPANFPFFYETPMGAGVACENALSETERLRVLERIDAGLSKMLQATAGKGFTAFRRHSDFYYALITPNAESSDGYPAIRLKNGMLVSGITIGLEENFALMMVLPQQSSHLDYLEASARHESEHIEAYFNDRKYYELTKRPENHIHPMYP